MMKTTATITIAMITATTEPPITAALFERLAVGETVVKTLCVDTDKIVLLMALLITPTDALTASKRMPRDRVWLEFNPDSAGNLM